MTEESESWEKLKPIHIVNNPPEGFEDYWLRIQKLKQFRHIPKIVFEQWLWAHHNEEEGIKNYGWIDYEIVEFSICEWTNPQLTNIYVLEQYRSYFETRSQHTDFNQFSCSSEDLYNWKHKGTWSTPPIIIDLNSFGDKIPAGCELIGPYQLVEGHSRLGYLQALIKMQEEGKCRLADKHEIYLMKTGY